MDRRYPGDASDRGETPTLPTAKVHQPAHQTVQVLGAVPRGNHVDDNHVTVRWSTRNIFPWCLRRVNYQ